MGVLECLAAAGFILWGVLGDNSTALVWGGVTLFFGVLKVVLGDRIHGTYEGPKPKVRQTDSEAAD